MILPILLAALAVLVTLAYASVLDVRDRSVPVRVWYPLYVVGSIAVIWYLVTAPAGAGTVAGYAALIVTVIYGIELEAENGEVPGHVLALAVAATLLQGIAWGFLWNSLGPVAILGFIALAAALWKGLDLERRASRAGVELPPFQQWFRFWHIPLVIALQGVAWCGLFLAGKGGAGDLLLILVALYAELFLAFAAMNLFGGADAIAFICIALFVPVFPLEPVLGYPPLRFLPFSALTNAVILNLVTPLGFFLWNAMKGNRAPFPYTFFGYPVEGKAIEKSYGFVMEDFHEEGGELRRRFIPIGEALGRMVKGKGRIYTKHLREHPERFTRELALYRRAGVVWISYGVPFILPILAGFAVALFGGDLLFAAMSAVAGV